MADGSIDTRTAHISAEEALALHASGRPGKLETRISKPITTARDLSLAYSPGVAEPCLHIQRDPSLAYDYTAKGNMVAVVSNGTAVLGLGNLGAVAAKPVMEGKIALFKRFADIDGIDLEIDSEDVDDVVNAVRFLAGFGGINLEDIKAPGMLRDRAAAARADGHPGVPRRPARHRDRCGGGADQRLPSHRAANCATRSWW